MNILMEIVESTRQSLLNKKDLESVKLQALNIKSDSPFRFEKTLIGNNFTFICEVKKASPSQGIIDNDFNYLGIAEEYERAGAGCLSVLTEEKYFLGSPIILNEISKKVSLPILRKDFIIDEYQIYEAKNIGADAILLITKILTQQQLADFISLADRLEMSALIEVRNEQEIAAAVKAGARIIGVNNRNLENFQVDLSASEQLGKFIPDNVLFISESGISTKEDIERLKKIKANGALIGQAFMKSKNKISLMENLK